MKSRSLMEAGAFLLLSFMLSVALAGTAQAGPQQAGPAPIEPVTGDEPPPSVIARKLQELFAVADSRQLSGSARTRAIVQAHGELFGDERNRATLDGVTDSNLDLLFQAAREVEFYTGEMSHVLEMMRLHEELESRGIAEGQHRADLYGALIHARLFDRARTFERAHPTQGLEKLPEVRQAADAGGAGPTVWTISPDARLLTARALDLRGPATIVVVSHPTCHFSRGAAAAISDDAVLGPVFARHARWLVPPGHRLDFELMQQWNRQHPRAPVSLVVERYDWPMFDDWATPTFYFFKGGALTRKVSGWPLDGAGRRDEIIAALDEIGLLE